jgi:glycogen operon protein
MALIGIETGAPEPLGASVETHGVNFALFSAHAENVELCLYDDRGEQETARLPLPGRTGDVWHGFVANALAGQRYGYRVYGPYEPNRGHRFNHHKLLIDPYARALDRPVRLTSRHFGYRRGDPAGDLSFDESDSAADTPKCVVMDSVREYAGRRPATSWRDTIVYELHVRGMTIRRPDIPERLRGTLAGLASPGLLAYFRDLGITAVELLPVQPIVDEPRLVELGMRNYWGYNSIAFFALEPRYTAAETEAEFRSFVAAFHEAGIEVFLDIVFNHTAEGDVFGPTLSFRGIDNASYYWLLPEDPRFYANYTATGNTFNVRHAQVRRLILDALRHWVSLGVDGFRFDLASTLARADGECRPDRHFIPEIAADPALEHVKLIAEPWDATPDGYQIGRFPPPWREWNDWFRNDARRFWTGHMGQVGGLATRLAGSSDLFATRGPDASINFITAHDGFTLEDLVTYAQKHNWANGEGNVDGTNENYSANFGVEGPTADPKIRGLRRRQKRNLMATLLLSQGVPLLTAGDERGRTQIGNNNAYCQDNPISWMDWRPMDHDDAQFLRFVRRLIGLRKASPDLRRESFFTGRPANGRKDIVWLHPDGREMNQEDWNDAGLRSFGCCFGEKTCYLLLLNGAPDPVIFQMQDQAGVLWEPLLNTSAEDGSELGLPVSPPVPLFGDSLVLFRVRS